jgi:hypothetical protein
LILSEYFKALAADDGKLLDNVLDDEPPLEQQQPDFATHPYLTKEHLRYIFEDLAPGLVKKMARERSTSDPYLESCADVLQSLLLFSIPVMKHKIWNVEFLLAIRQILDFDCSLHKLHYTIPEVEIQRLYTRAQSWRTELKAGDKVDALLHSYDTQRSQSRGAGWSKAEIIDVDGDKLSLAFDLEPVLSNRTLDRWSNELAIAGTETAQIWQWKATLKENDLVDALDDTYTWRQSTLIRLYEEKEGDKVIPMALVGLRVYQANGPRSDERGPYDGFGQRFDEKIPLYSPKITGYRTRSTKDKADADG